MNEIKKLLAADGRNAGCQDSEFQTLDLLAVGAHPDDLELAMGGTIARHAALGLKVGLVDLTAGEMGSNGTPEVRLAEAETAGRILGVAARINLGLPDFGLDAAPDKVQKVAALIRKYRPSVLCLPYWEARHPDHVAASHLVARAWFAAGLRRFKADGEPWRPPVRIFFIQDHQRIPSFVVDVGDFYRTKVEAIKAHRSQVESGGAEAFSTYVNNPAFLQAVETRDRYLGTLIGAAYGEGFIYEGQLAVGDLTGIRPSLRR
ncbi:MAG: bacillithiol biosynthesis deacetylase BshB1 [Firmicutes bacterium]|nr:bacillithiol biosynthesis deacetylase BshB1 [Bacillota bacterium]